ncbi:cytochrome C oxidase subunit IV family protein [Haloferax larsenii]|uniref:Cytochrome C oxidase subunit IV family protein n=1 Tax=Haloferax larsenii TaxID=302484 RepID=A0ABY5RC30_HALLR|nr:cytochrome C oxidase subunit IV family protein [Haloferax larsenii]UVE49882.1 cytochrome C oxidase subunit IV family protein [Haloferax larsenii]
MVSTKFYTAIYVVLFVSATVQVLVEFAGLAYWTAFGIIIVLSAAKAVLVAAYFQHLRWEPRSLTYLVGIGLVAALALTVAASYSLL